MNALNSEAPEPVAEYSVLKKNTVKAYPWVNEPFSLGHLENQDWNQPGSRLCDPHSMADKLSDLGMARTVMAALDPFPRLGIPKAFVLF